MTGPVDPPLTVPVQWALHGKAADSEGYRILSCSTGDLSKANFADALGRFAVGALDTLPQVSVSYLQPAARSPGEGYLALAIDWFGAEGRSRLGGLPPVDTLGRTTAFTSYFCAPYRHLAERAVTYQDMYQAFGSVTLPLTDGSPKAVTIRSSPGRAPAIDELAMYVAPLLLTGTPVCVLDAEATSVDERLRFIDAVMALLPYGFRARMTAATWTRATYQNHRFRLYFSSAPRTDQQDHVVRWGAPDQMTLPPGEGRDYFDWLADKVSPLTRLASLSAHETDLRFDSTAPSRALELVDPLQGRRRGWSRGQYVLQSPRAPGGGAAPPAAPPALGQQVPALGLDEITEVLRECAEYIRQRNTARLKSAASRLAGRGRADSALLRQAETSPDLKAQAEAVDGRRRRYREQIKEYGLLRPHDLGGRGRDLYAALLEAAFGRPLTYTGYCRVEECLSGEPGEYPHPALLQAMKDGEMAFETKAIVLYLTRQERGEKELTKWYGTGEIDPVALVHWLAKDWGPRSHHARVICDLTLDFIRRLPSGYDQGSLRSALHQHGFLAHALQARHPAKEQYQVSVLFQFLQAAYPGGVGRQAIGQLLTGTSHPPTPALLAAILMNVSTTGESQFALEAYVRGSLTLMDMHPGPYAQLLTRVPALDPDPGAGWATGPIARPAAQPDPTETILQRCAGQALARNLAGLRDSLTALRVYSDYAANRARYRQIVVEHQLLSADLGLGSLAGEFYDVLLKLAFGTPLGYQGYCQLVDCLPAAGPPEPRPHEALLRAIDRAASAELAGSRPDLRVTAIVAAYLDSAQRGGKARPRQPDPARVIDGKFRSGHLDAVRLIEALAETWERPRHAELVLDVLTGYLTAARVRGTSYDRPAVLRSLQGHGHLAPPLRARYPESVPAQISALAQLLDAVYPDKLDEPTAWTILSAEAQTDALLSVVTGKTDDPQVKARITRLIRDSAYRQGG